MANDPIDKLRRTAFPNPKRIGCPEPAIFEALKRREVSFDDPVWTHIEECSPCYCQFAEIREGLFKKDRRSEMRKAARACLVVIVLLAVGASFYIWHRSKAIEGQSAIASNRGEAAVLNFEDGSELRGAQGSSGVSANPSVQHLRRNQLNLTVYLPLGSPAGEYELDISGRTVGACGAPGASRLSKTDLLQSLSPVTCATCLLGNISSGFEGSIRHGMKKTFLSNRTNLPTIASGRHLPDLKANGPGK